MTKTDEKDSRRFLIRSASVVKAHRGVAAADDWSDIKGILRHVDKTLGQTRKDAPVNGVSGITHQFLFGREERIGLGFHVVRE